MPKRLALKLILALTLMVLLVEGITGFFIIRAQERQLLDTLIIGADQLSRGITSATWHAMLADQRPAAYDVIRNVAQQEGISKIRIFNRDGRVMFSSRPDEIGTIADISADACALCHSSHEPRVTVDVTSRARIFPGESNQRKLAMVTPIYNEPSCSQAACHAHPVSTKVLGLLDVDFDLRRVDQGIASLQLRVLGVILAQVALVSIFVVFFTRRFVVLPIRKLIEGTRAISSMQLDTPIEIDSSEELGELARSFDTMRQRLRQAMEEANASTQSLESKVAERTEELKAAQQKLVHSDRLASLGQLAASVAHEINNPVSGVLNLSMLMQRILKEDGIPAERVPEFRKYLSQITTETSRVGRIVADMLAFSRRGRPTSGIVNLNLVVMDTLSLVSHQLQLSNVTVNLDLMPNLPVFSGVASQIQQVVMNLILNGAEATQSKGDGRVAISTRLSKGRRSIILDVRDTGDGIPEENLSKIFDPFFTTKVGKGVGLGLSVAYGIVKAHGGDIEVQSEQGIGTIFKVTLPIEAGSAAISAAVAKEEGA